MLRSIREFLQEAYVLMIMFFNPILSYTEPVIVDGKGDLLGECYPRRPEIRNTDIA
ncbi:hypothetical protein DPMN_005395 [Dreissena polymorpha]|uniref:Uncharacterized protein n=1 Tax=Dreissena polymorpha TaxID=45954 RepID=A0A9D4MTG4_DREPO|nr:hypothetical protein DPMN_005395 [Dreissena polymorpha]